MEALHPANVTRDSLQGFAEGQGVVSIEPEHFTKKNDSGPRAAGFASRTTAARCRACGPKRRSMRRAPSLARIRRVCEYRMYLFTPGAVTANLILSPTLNFVAGRGLRVAVSFDDEAPQGGRHPSGELQRTERQSRLGGVRAQQCHER